MDSKALETLDFPKILAQLAGHTSFSAGRELALALTPTDDLREAERRQQETAEARRLLGEGSTVHLGGVYDVRPYLVKARLSAPLLPGELLEIRSTLLRARALQQTLTRASSHFPHLADIAARMECCPHVAEEIGRCIDERAEIRDSASPELSRIRQELREAHTRLLSTLEKMVAAPANAAYLQEPLVTQRHGRYVIPLKAEFKGRIPGLVHDQSASGATLFIEPLATVELGNRWRECQLEEEREVRRILIELAELVGDEAPYIRRTVETLAELDLALAKARYAEAINGVQPKLVGFHKHGLQATGLKVSGSNVRPSNLKPETLEPGTLIHPGTTLDLRAARHPLLDPRTVVPIDVHLSPEYFVLVITGPNTGGKTVTLKTVGLLALMAQAGLAIPAAEGSALSVFDAIYADIGDEQSIEQNLSTFSSHMTNIVRILRQATPRSLVLLDELGAGTDPEEGSALARALLSHLVERSITTLTATHYSELKIYAHATPGVRNACVEFDPETLAPTFELSIGLPGRSNALAIARRLGLHEGILAEAEALVQPTSLQADALLEEIRRSRQAAREAQAEAEAALHRVQALEMELRHRLSQIEAARRAVLNEARAEAQELLEATREEVAQVRARLGRSADLHEQWLAEAEAELARRAGETARLEPEVEPPAVAAEPFRVGERVWVPSLQAGGEILSLDEAEGEAEVQIGAFRLALPLRRLRKLKAQEPEPPARPPVTAPPAAGPLHPSPGIELDLRGLRVEEMLPALQKYLDEAYLAGLPWVRIIHGKGTGRLREAVWDLLRRHPYVVEQRLGERGEGDEGVTVATLAGG
ncbi:MAG: Smr/MutS family protein [Anaerolineae bacterium]|nr:Smr/MutS family protein [Anaerolineae bacterium]